MTSWGGTSIATTLRLTLRIWSMMGKTRMRPGPFAPMTFPSLKTTPLWYSFNTRMADRRNRNRTITTTA